MISTAFFSVNRSLSSSASNDVSPHCLFNKADYDLIYTADSTDRCQTTKQLPVCIEAVWVRGPRRVSPDNCAWDVAVCYSYDEEHVFEYLKNRDANWYSGKGFPEGSIEIEIVNYGQFRRGGATLAGPTYSLRGREGGYGKFTEDKGWSDIWTDRQYPVDALVVYYYSPNGSKAELTKIDLPTATCPKEEESPQVRVVAFDADCGHTGIRVFVDNFEYGVLYTVRYVRKDGSVYNEVQGYTDESGFGAITEGEGFYDGGGKVVVTNTRNGKSTTVEIPDFWNAPNLAKPAEAPQVAIKHTPAPGRPCLYEIEVKTASRRAGVMFLVKGGLNPSDLEAIDRMWSSNSSPSAQNSNWAGYQIQGYRQVAQWSDTYVYSLEGPAEYTLVYVHGNCRYAVPIVLPQCNIIIPDNLGFPVIAYGRENKIWHSEIGTGKREGGLVTNPDQIPHGSHVDRFALESQVYGKETERNKLMSLKRILQ